MKVERLTVVDDAAFADKLWQFYQDAFAKLDRSCPIAQTWPRSGFDKWLSNERVIVIVISIRDEIVAMGVVTDDISVEPLLSPRYFTEHHPDGAWYFPAIAISPAHRKNIRIAKKLIKSLMKEIPADNNTTAYFFFSTDENATLAKLVVRFCEGRVEGKVISTESLFRMSWT